MTKPMEMYQQNDVRIQQLIAQNQALNSSIAREKHDNIILQKKLRDSKQINEYLWALVGAVIALGIGLTMVASAI